MMYGFIVTVLCASFFIADVSATELAPASPRAEYILHKVQEADVRCRDVPLTVTTETDVGTSMRRITERPIVLCAYSEETKRWHMIELALKYPVEKGYILCVQAAPTVEERKNCVLPFRVVTPEYRVTHLSGFGVTRFAVNVYHHEERLTVYRTRHIWFDDDVLRSKNIDQIVATARGVNYTPYHADFFDQTLVENGIQFLFQKIHAAQLALGLESADGGTVRSNAFPDRALARVVPWQIPLSLAVIEQVDDKTFEENKQRATEAVFIEYALNRDGAFAWSQSGANAIGALQFTNKDGNGTYSAVVAKCSGANLEPRFGVGARDLSNVLKAAICLIDLEVAQFPAIKSVYLRNPTLGGIYPVAAYNGGPTPARALYAWIKKRGIDIERAEIVVPQAFTGTRMEKCPCANTLVKIKKGKKKRTVEHIVIKVHNTETPGYIVKYIYLLNYLADKGLE